MIKEALLKDVNTLANEKLAGPARQFLEGAASINPWKKNLARSVAQKKTLDWAAKQGITLPDNIFKQITPAEPIKEIIKKEVPSFAERAVKPVLVGGLGLAGGALVANNISGGEDTPAVSEDLMKQVPEKLNIPDYPWENNAPVGRPFIRPNFKNSTNIIRPATKPFG